MFRENYVVIHTHRLENCITPIFNEIQKFDETFLIKTHLTSLFSTFTTTQPFDLFDDTDMFLSLPSLLLLLPTESHIGN